MTAAPADHEISDGPARPLFTPAFILLLVLQATFGLAFSSYFLLPKYLATELRAGPTAIGNVSAIAAIAGVVSVPVVGRWIDAGRRRRLMIVGSLVMAISSLVFLRVREVGPLVLGLRFVQGVAFTLFLNAVGTLATDRAPKERLGQALGLLGLASLVTNALAPALAEVLTAHYGWSYVFWFAAITATASAALCLLIHEEPRAAVQQRTRLGAVLSPRALAVLYATAVVGAAFGSVMTFAQPLALEVGDREMSGLFLGYAATATFVRLFLGATADRLGRQRTASWAMAAYTLVVLATAALNQGGLPLIGAGLGVAHGFLYPALNALAVERTAVDRRGTMMTFFSGAFNAGFAICVTALGAFAEWAGYRPVFVVAGVLASSAVLALVRLPADASP